ncbi:translation initiation factor IF-2-like [Canis lupus familiaris]|uniref:translation initiation factor IF-2-like n=1 Tax=Canis lupus familiaris TaxID=9615 RepID=UPI0018F6488F|nr:translation initiation factor IF-2-like [Canis lupus familiaris]
MGLSVCGRRVLWSPRRGAQALQAVGGRAAPRLCGLLGAVLRPPAPSLPRGPVRSGPASARCPTPGSGPSTPAPDLSSRCGRNPPGLLLAHDSSPRRAANCRWASGATAAAGAGLGGGGGLGSPASVLTAGSQSKPVHGCRRRWRERKAGTWKARCSRSVACAPLPGTGPEAFACNLRKCRARLLGRRGILCARPPHPPDSPRVLCATRGAGAPGANQAVGWPHTRHRGGRTQGHVAVWGPSVPKAVLFGGSLVPRGANRGLDVSGHPSEDPTPRGFGKPLLSSSVLRVKIKCRQVTAGLLRPCGEDGMSLTAGHRRTPGGRLGLRPREGSGHGLQPSGRLRGRATGRGRAPPSLPEGCGATEIRAMYGLSTCGKTAPEWSGGQDCAM